MKNIGLVKESSSHYKHTIQFSTAEKSATAEPVVHHKAPEEYEVDFYPHCVSVSYRQTRIDLSSYCLSSIPSQDEGCFH